MKYDDFKFNIDEVIEHCSEKAKDKYLQGMLCHANPDDGQLDTYIKSGREYEQLVSWLNELKHLRVAFERVLADLENEKKYFRSLWNDNHKDEDYSSMLAYKYAINAINKEMKFNESN
jgi:hypothetical protein